MKTSSPAHAGLQGRAVAFTAGLVFLAGTCTILFEDVLLQNAPIKLKHYQTLAVLAGTLLAGHLAKEASRHAQRGAWAMFGLVFLAGTALVIYSSVGRQTADTIQTTAQIAADAQRRIEVVADRARAQAMLDEASKKLHERCVIGKANRDTCNGIRATIAVYSAATAGHDAELAKLGPPRVSAPEAEQFAEIVHTIAGTSKAKVKAAALMIVPFLVALFLEFGTIQSFGYCFRHTAAVASVGHSAPEAPAKSDTDQTSFATAEPSNIVELFLPAEPPGNTGRFDADDKPNGSPRNGGTGIKPNRPSPRSPNGSRMTRRDEALADVLTQRALGRSYESQQELADRHGVAKSTMSDWLKEWERDGLIPARRTIGRCKVLADA